jgi:hypothetical protein
VKNEMVWWIIRQTVAGSGIEITFQCYREGVCELDYE